MRMLRECVKCGWQWFARVEISHTCPKCKSSLWDGHAPRQPGLPKGHGLIEGTKAFLIMAALKERYPDQEVPYGAVSALAHEFGVSRERARQLGKAYGVSIIHEDRRPRCMSCGDVLGKGSGGGLCRNCHYIDIACDQCGTLFQRLASEYLGHVNRDTRYTGRAFCSPACFAGYYRGRERPFTAEHIEAIRAAANRRMGERIPKHGTAAEYQHGCHCDLCHEAWLQNARNYYAKNRLEILERVKARRRAKKEIS